MDRSRSKRSYYYDHQDYEPEPFSRTRPRYNSAPSPHNYPNSRHHGGGGGRGGNGGGGFVGGARGGSGSSGGRMMGGKTNDTSGMVTTCYRILCQDSKAGGVIGKSGSIIKVIRQHTGAWVNVHELVPGDEERIIEISDTRRRDPDGRMPAFSPAQEALFLIHERILESESFGDEGDYGGPGRGGVGSGGNNNGRVVTRLVVSKMHVGSLLGKGGKIIEQMRIETKTQIRVLPRDHTLPRCISMGEEIVQIVGDANAVKSAISVVSSRLKESQHRDRSHLQERYHSEDRYMEDDFNPRMNNSSRRPSLDGAPYGSRLQSNSPNNRGGNYSSRPNGYIHESEVATRGENSQSSFEDLVFRILCPNDRVERVVGQSNGIMDLLQSEIGVDVKVSDSTDGSDGRIIIISSDEGPDDELFPAQEALLHIQTRILDLVPDKDNIVTTRLLVSSREIGCLDGDESLSQIKKLSGADVEILPREKTPAFISGSEKLVQIVGEIKAAREAVVEVTARLRSYLYKEFSQGDRDMPPPSGSVPGHIGNGPSGTETTNNRVPPYESLTSEAPSAISQNLQTTATGQPSKDAGLSSSETSRQNESDRREDSASSRREDTPTSLNRIQVPLVTRSTLEVVIPEYAVSRFLGKSRNKLAQISELSGANVTLVEDGPDVNEKVIRISGSPEQAERAQSLLQGFFLSIQEDVP